MILGRDWRRKKHKGPWWREVPLLAGYPYVNIFCCIENVGQLNLLLSDWKKHVSSLSTLVHIGTHNHFCHSYRVGMKTGIFIFCNTLTQCLIICPLTFAECTSACRHREIFHDSCYTLTKPIGGLWHSWLRSNRPSLGLSWASSVIYIF